MATTPAKLMTFAEFEKVPDHPRGLHCELRQGELVLVAPPKHKHYLVQRRLRRLLEKAAGGAGEVDIELGFRPLPEYEYMEADVAFVSRDRWDQIPREGNMQGPPELVIEVLSPSNTAAEIRRKRKLCLENGSHEFWVVDGDHREVELSTPDGHTITYKSGQQIPLFFAPGAHVAVDAIFE